MIRYFLVALMAGFVLSSCVPNKRIVYLQSKAEPKRGTVVNKDSTYREYNTSYKDYRLRPKDVISVRIASITPGEYDFIQKYEEALGIIRKLNQYDQANKNATQGMRMGAQGGNDGMSSYMLDRLQSGFILDDRGNLELPYIGTVELKDLTIAETETLIKQRLKGFFETPVIRVQLLSFHFTILGEVNKEGRYTVFDPNATVIDAIAIAENLNDFADRSAIKIVRMEGEKAKVIYVNTLSEDLLGNPGYFLQPNDLIIVPPLEARATRKYTLPTYVTTISLVTSTLAFILFLMNLK